jgi:hypothetical protein
LIRPKSELRLFETIAAIFMNELLYTAADGTLPNGYEKNVGLGELRIVQAVKQILNVNLNGAGR